MQTKKLGILVFILIISSFSLSAVVVIDSLYNVTGNWVINDSVYVGPNGIIQNSDATRTLTVNGHITNNGIIRNNPGGHLLYMEVSGNIQNSGDWENLEVEVTGAGQRISCPSDSAFSVTYFRGNDSGTTNLWIDTDVKFINTSFNLYDDTMHLVEGVTLNLNGGNLYNGTITGTNAAMNMINDNYIHDLDIDVDVMTLYGVCQLGDQYVDFNGNVTNNSIIQNRGGAFTVDFNGDITNNGIIRNNPGGYLLYTDVSGNIINNGTWENHYIQLEGSEQHISRGVGFGFSPGYLYGNSSSRGNIYFDSDMEFNWTSIDLNGDTVNLQNGMTLTLNGGYLNDGSLVGISATLQMNSDNYIYSLAIDIADLTLSGVCQIGNNSVTMTGDVVNDGILQNRSGSFTLNYYGNITNNGTIRNNPGGYLFYTNISGNIINNGGWTNHHIILIGSNQHISIGDGFNLSPGYLYGNSSSRGILYFDSDILFIGTSIDLNGDIVNLQEDMTLTMNGGNLYDGSLVGTTATMDMTADNHIYSIDIDIADLILSGVCQIANNSVSITGDITNDGTIQNRGGSFTLICSGDVTNNGIIQNNPGGYLLYINISGNIENNGVWSNQTVQLTGADQYITCEFGSIFECGNFLGNTSSRGDVYFDSDIGFSYTAVDLNGDNVVLSPGMELTLTGGYLFDGSLSGTSATFNMSADNYIYSLVVNVTNLTLNGVCQIADNSLDLNCNIVNNSTLQNRSGHFTVDIVGNITNNGAIQNNPSGYTLNTDISGDIINNGLWTVSELELTGTNQHISCVGGNIFQTTYFKGNGTYRSNQYFDSDVSFVGTHINLYNDNLILQDGMTLDMTGGYLTNGTLSGPSVTMTMSTDNYLYSLVNSVTNLTLEGTCQIANSEVFFNGNVTNNSILQNRSGNFNTYFNADITNNGTIQNNPGGYALYVYLYQNVNNNGAWTNSITYVNGSVDQTIDIQNSNEITGLVYFDSDVTGSPYQWKFDDVDLNHTHFTGETGSRLTWNVPVASGWLGTFYCVANGQSSRDIIITDSGAPPFAPLNLTISIIGSNVELDWDSATGATIYKVYSDTDPYGSFDTVEWTGSNTQWSEAIPDDKKFYRVTASN